jgi:hypothetical protein
MTQTSLKITEDLNRRGDVFYVQRSTEKRLYYHCYCGKAISITYYECVFVALDIQHAMSMHHIFICGLPRSTVFFTLSRKRHDFRGEKKAIEHIVCVSVFSISLSEAFFIRRRTERDMNKNVFWSSRKVPIILVRF